MNKVLIIISRCFRASLPDGSARTGLISVTRLRNDQRGIALVTALMMTLISLSIVMSLMYMITLGTKTSGANKRYRTTLQATYGGLDLITRDIMLSAFADPLSAASLPGLYPGISMVVSNCFAQKLSYPTSAWPADCSTTASAKENPDISFVLQSTTTTPYTIYAKVIDTSAGNTATGVGGNTETALNPSLRSAHNVTEGGEGGGGATIPRLFRIEVQGERSNNPVEKSQMSVLYAY